MCDISIGCAWKTSKELSLQETQEALELISNVLCVAPLRISFVGGGTDISSFFRLNEGFVVSSSITKYVYVHAKIHDDSFGEKYRIAYSKVEHADEVSAIDNQIVRSCIQFLEIDFPLQISTLSDLPAGTGLGSSSSFTVALLHALHALKGERPTKHQLAEEACQVEIEIMKQPIGKQDQYAAAFGGLNKFTFACDNSVSVSPIRISSANLRNLERRTTLFWTGMKREASEILRDQHSRRELNEAKLIQMAKLAKEFSNSLEQVNIDWNKLRTLVTASWALKTSLSTLISNGYIDEIMGKLEDQYAPGIKLLGAGQGGFILLLGPNTFSTPRGEWQRLKYFKPTFDLEGSRIISQF